MPATLQERDIAATAKVRAHHENQAETEIELSILKVNGEENVGKRVGVERGMIMIETEVGTEGEENESLLYQNEKRPKSVSSSLGDDVGFEWFTVRNST